MKISIVIAFLLLIAGMAQITDWVIFSIQHKALDLFQLNAVYLKRMPSFFQLYFRNPVLSTLVCMTLLTISGILFIRARKKIFLALGIFALVMAFWQLFSLM
jgi:hypothetical protein